MSALAFERYAFFSNSILIRNMKFVLTGLVACNENKTLCNTVQFTQTVQYMFRTIDYQMEVSD